MNIFFIFKKKKKLNCGLTEIDHIGVNGTNKFFFWFSVLDIHVVLYRIVLVWFLWFMCVCVCACVCVWRDRTGTSTSTYSTSASFFRIRYLRRVSRIRELDWIGLDWVLMIAN